jgi:hypothetical protein
VLSIVMQPASIGVSPATQDRALAGAVRAEHGQQLAGLDADVHVEVERADLQRDRGGEAHAAT